MKRIVCMFALTPMLGSVIYADWKIITRTSDRNVAEFFKGALMRRDFLPAYTTVLDFDNRRQVNWRSDLRQYEIVEWPPQQPSDSPSGPVITIERNTTDTGERRQFFGRPARRLVTRVTRSDGPEMVIDGWYIEAQDSLSGKPALAVRFSSRRLIWVAKGPRLPGLNSNKPALCQGAFRCG